MHQRRDAVIARLARRADDAEEGVAMLLALMVILMLLTISITVAGVTLSQVKPSQLERKTTVTESAAEAGFEEQADRVPADDLHDQWSAAEEPDVEPSGASDHR